MKYPSAVSSSSLLMASSRSTFHRVRSIAPECLAMFSFLVLTVISQQLWFLLSFLDLSVCSTLITPHSWQWGWGLPLVSGFPSFPCSGSLSTVQASWKEISCLIGIYALLVTIWPCFTGGRSLVSWPAGRLFHSLQRSLLVWGLNVSLCGLDWPRVTCISWWRKEKGIWIIYPNVFKPTIFI